MEPHLIQIPPRAFSHRSSSHVYTLTRILGIGCNCNPAYIRSEWYSFYGGPLTSARMAHLLFNILQPVPNLLYFWLMVGDQGIEPRIRAPDAKRRIAVLAFGQSRAYKRVMPFHQSPIFGVEAAYIPEPLHPAAITQFGFRVNRKLPIVCCYTKSSPYASTYSLKEWTLLILPSIGLWTKTYVRILP